MTNKNRYAVSKRSPEVQEAFEHFLNCHPPKLFGRNLRNMLIEVLTYQKGNQPLYMNSLMPAIEMFFEVLDAAEDESEITSKKSTHQYP